MTSTLLVCAYFNCQLNKEKHRLKRLIPTYCTDIRHCDETVVVDAFGHNNHVVTIGYCYSFDLSFTP